MGKSEKISVIIPVYNTGRYLEKSVRSVMAQTYGNLEIICVNDGSTDNSQEILERLKKEDSRIVIVNKENGGLGDARNCGIRHSTAEWLAFVDSDDTIQPDTFSIICKAFVSDPDMIHFGVNMISEDGGMRVAADERYYTIKYSGLVGLNDSIRRRSDTSACNKLFRKSVLDRYGIVFEKIWYEDFAFVMQYLCVIDNVYYIQDKLYNYLRHHGSIMSETFVRTPRSIDHLYGIDYLYDFLVRHKILGKHEDMLTKLFVSYYANSIKYITKDRIPEVVDYATGLYDKYTFMHRRVVRREENGTVVFSRSRQRRWSSRFFQKIFSIRLEWMDYNLYKVIRVFNIAVYKELRSSI